MAPAKKKPAPTATDDSAIIDAPAAPTDAPKSPIKHRRKSSVAAAADGGPQVFKPEELKAELGEDKDLKITKEISKLGWKMNTSPGALDEAAQMKNTPIAQPRVKKLTIFFPTGLHINVRSSATTTGKTLGVTVMDALQAIHKQMKKKADDELELPVLADLEWGRGDDLKNAEGGEWPAVVLVKQKKEAPQGNKKKGGK